ncbi:protein N-terminal and lysine N-methyltransferase EFM7 isoform X1 [Cucumis melo]|uniref:Protein N-terminal and lysine N-methyltransferase EFM7 isoform X1 n=1 Tax=Cucumis melo TaxID=3656 RepID=A0A1S3BN36_CUCME|nr:protein N-terminal and lysine N-methyltransferase EFM7 isoform X1 [Cucumis melo]XP_050944264.1 protein N-terminal and lysine N-methyltransferase EFM7 isoform X1 [Cucumis melo]XP_050944265.1 protein N-terminal and lysine N-methyltransferase EFM7 isoform X1 [Cucumis melo]
MDIALFSPSSLFPDDDESSNDAGTSDTLQSYEERMHQFPGMELVIREFSFHQLNANLLWPGTFAFAEWLVQNSSWIQGQRCIELGSGTGSLAIFLRKSFDLDITTSDYDDQEIEENITYNCRVNGITPALPHVKHTWGENFPISDPDWDLVIASDILLYVKQYPNLIKTLSYLLKRKYSKTTSLSAVRSDETAGAPMAKPMFLMSWRRRIGKEDELLFFTGCENAGLEVKHLGSRVYCIKSMD